MSSVIAYHSSDSKITKFNVDKRKIKPNSSTAIAGLFFSDVPQTTWGKFVYKVQIHFNTPAVFDMNKSTFNSQTVQEAFDAFLRGETSYLQDDLEKCNSGFNADEIIQKWRKLDFIVLKNCNYAKHRIEYIVPASSYNGIVAKIVNLGLVETEALA